MIHQYIVKLCISKNRKKTLIFSGNALHNFHDVLMVIWSLNIKNDCYEQEQVHPSRAKRIGQQDCKDLRWQFEAGRPIFSSPSVVDDVVFVGEHTGFIYA